MLLGLGVVSASSFGTFPDVTFSAVERSLVPCSADVVLLDDGAALLSSTLNLASEITDVRLENLTGDCAGYDPVVVVIGDELLDLSTGTEVLFVIDEMPTLTGNDPVQTTLSSAIQLSDGVQLLYTLDSAGVAFCPTEASCTS